MSLRKLMIAAIFAASTIFVPASAQNIDAEAAQEEIAERIETAKERLNLTDEQIPQVEEILRESAEKRRAVLEKYDLGGGKKLGFREMRKLKSELEPIRKETTASLSAVLTPEQLAEYEKMQEEQRAEFRAKLQERRG